ncbi:GntT/GntP/DsdX family permease [Mucilaginibacter myungsuensis]|uniref:Gluconate permease n=1 Tax=Mucilaginibacter myungsuensis TaxID=649104 RepID=A0A929KW50_9SPHI|nr:gluconate:H+ symporter [Mucilaginibacter myungsuensis]MBE9661802.1 gluconate permease [Mucilaginibacter myungsuensis]MDN3599764.1 gluconate:H+ symporter [Mucilaginibacter myungsuensis]
MSLLYVLLAIQILLVLIIKKMNPMLALLIVSIITGLLLKMPADKVMASISAGIGNTLGSLIMVLALGAMIGKLAEDYGAAERIVYVLIKWFGIKNIQWAALLTGILVGIPLFYNAGFIVLLPLAFSIATATGLPKLYVGMPMIAALSITHGFLPPHPGPVALASIFHADVGKVLLYGLAISLPVAAVAGVLFPRLMISVKHIDFKHHVINFNPDKVLPSATKSFAIALMPVFLIIAGNLGGLFFTGQTAYYFKVLADPTFALLLSVLIILLILQIPLAKAMDSCVEGAKGITMIMLIIAAGGAFKQVLIDSGIGEEVKVLAAGWHASPYIIGWGLAAFLRITLGSSTVASLTAAGIVLPLIQPGISPELMVLAVGAGSLMLSHFNDTGFWMFKEYFGLTLGETFRSWTVMECIISVSGLVGVLVINGLVQP